ncbi:hypothetical protein OHB41_03560 [Streptomyces sp. NBC_01571]|nr:hypothetical protein [Streptomyces sp. NBC_01571]MCX4572275.1 hypothetical protein [Streptomyces sp. NBC_01571]
MAIVVTDSASPKGQVRVTNTDTGQAVQVPKQRDAIADATASLKGPK